MKKSLHRQRRLAHYDFYTGRTFREAKNYIDADRPQSLLALPTHAIDGALRITSDVAIGVRKLFGQDTQNIQSLGQQGRFMEGVSSVGTNTVDFARNLVTFHWIKATGNAVSGVLSAGDALVGAGADLVDKAVGVDHKKAAFQGT